MFEFLFRLSPIYKYKVSGHSMSPTLKEDSEVFVNRCAFVFRNPQKNTIIALKDPRDGKVLLKRITKVEKGKYFVEGDNKKHSTDSRDFGMIEKSDIIGKVLIYT